MKDNITAPYLFCCSDPRCVLEEKGQCESIFTDGSKCEDQGKYNCFAREILCEKCTDGLYDSYY